MKSPTSMASTTNRQRSPRTSSGYVRSLASLAGRTGATTLSVGFASAGQRGDEGCVHSQVRNGRPWDNFDSRAIKPAGSCDVEVCHDGGVSALGACFSADLCGCPF